MTTQHVALVLPSGYYRVMIAGRGCWEQAQWFALIDGKPRSVTVHFESFHANPGSDYFVYYSDRGAIAGIVPPGTTRVEVLPLHHENGAKPIPVIVQSGAYYADVRVGTISSGRNAEMRAAVPFPIYPFFTRTAYRDRSR